MTNEVNDVLENIKKLERLGAVAPRLIKHLRWVMETTHRAHHSPDGSWTACSNSTCLATYMVLRGICDEVGHL